MAERANVCGSGHVLDDKGNHVYYRQYQEHKLERHPDRNTITVHVDLKPGTTTATIHPGETLIIGMNRHVTMAEVHEMEEIFSDRIPGVQIVVVPNASNLAVYEPSEQQLRKEYELFQPELGGEPRGKE